jgi:outer membrane protein, heavy metal efflux system
MLRTVDVSRLGRRSAAAGCALLLACSARGQPAAPLGLGEALRIARERNADLAAAREGVEAARAQQQIAAQMPNPVLTATTNKIPTDGASAATGLGNGFLDRAYDSTVGLAQLVEIGGKRRSRRASAGEGLAIAQAHLADTDRTLFASVVRNYVAAVVAGEAARIGRESAESFARSARLAADREAAGDISASERAQVEIAAGRFQADAASAQAAFRAALRSLDALLAMPPGTNREASDGLDVLLRVIPPPDLAADDRGVLAIRHDLIALEAAVRRAQAERDLARANRFPDPTVLAQYERQPPDQRNTVGIGVALAVPVVNRNAGPIAAADVALSGARRELESARLRVRSELASTRDALDAAAARAARYANELLPKAERVRSTVEYAYGQGGASLLELLEAERNANEIRLAAASAQGDVIATRADFAAARTASLAGSRP